MGIFKLGPMRAMFYGAINALIFLSLTAPKLFQNSICRCLGAYFEREADSPKMLKTLKRERK
jgi:hypothetical protein